MKEPKQRSRILLLAALLVAIAGVVLFTWMRNRPVAIPAENVPVAQATASSELPEQTSEQTPVPAETEPNPEPSEEQPEMSAGIEAEITPLPDMPRLSWEQVPEYSGEPYTEINNNIPFFVQNELVPFSFEVYAQRDSLNRCGEAYASVGQDLMPTEERGDISAVTPSGWNQAQYEIVDGGWLYNRCHLIGHQLSGEDANEDNLITGTRYFNVEGMLPFENMVADYIYETGNHVLYRVTPLFVGDELVARGVEIEAESVEDGGEGILFNVVCYNVQPGVTIRYADGSSVLAPEEPVYGIAYETDKPVINTPPAISDSGPEPAFAEELAYIGNTGTGTFHVRACPDASAVSDLNRIYIASAQDAQALGLAACGVCNPA